MIHEITFKMTSPSELRHSGLVNEAWFSIPWDSTYLKHSRSGDLSCPPLSVRCDG